MRAKEFLAAGEQVAFIKFMFDSTWEQVKRRWAKELEREEGRKSAELASKRADVVKRNRSKPAKKPAKRKSGSRPKTTTKHEKAKEASARKALDQFEKAIDATPPVRAKALSSRAKPDQVAIRDAGRPQRDDPSNLGS